MQARTQAKNSVDQRLADPNLTWARVVSDVLGKRARRLLAALVAGARAPQQLSAMALGTWRRQMPHREVALAGPLTAHHARRIAGARELVEVLGRQMAEPDQQRQALLSEVAPQREQRASMPGVDEMTACDIIAEFGRDLTRFGAASRLAAGAELAPGHNARAGKRRRGRSAPGPSVCPPGGGAMGVGDAAALDLCGADVSPLGGQGLNFLSNY